MIVQSEIPVSREGIIYVFTDHGQEAGGIEDVVLVVDEDASDELGIAIDEELKIGLGDDGAFDIELLIADLSQDVILQSFQSAGGSFFLPQSAGQMQYVYVFFGADICPDLVVQKAGFEYGKVKGLTIEGNEDGFGLEQLDDAIERIDLGVGIGQEKLFYYVFIFLVVTQAHHEGDGATSAESGGLEIQHQEVFHVPLYFRIELGPTQDNIWKLIWKKGEAVTFGISAILRSGDIKRILQMPTKLTLDGEFQSFTDQLAPFAGINLGIGVDAVYIKEVHKLTK